MHAPVGLSEIANEIQGGKAATRNRIEQTDFDIRVLVNQQQASILCGRKDVIKQEAYPNTPIRRFQKCLHHDRTRHIVLHQEVLKIDTLLCNFSQP